MGDGRLKFIRWKYVAPRIALLLAITASIRLGLDPLLHYVIVTSGQAATGAKVEFASIETSIWDGRVELRDLKVANPQSLLRNLVEAEKTELSIDVNALFHKRLVVRNGEISGIKFDTERAESGELEIVIDESAGPSMFDPLTAKAGEWAGQWFDSASERLDTDFADQLKTPQVARALEDRWKQYGESLRTRAADLKARGKQIEDEFREAKKNPLRGIERIPALQAQLKEVRQELASLQKEIKNLPAQVRTDREALLTAKKSDEEFVKQQLKFDGLDGDNLTQVLLGEPVALGTHNALEWVSWVRKRLPTNSTKQIAKQRSRGTDVAFGNAQPQIYIERLSLALTAPCGAEPLEFTGSLTNLCDQPRLLAEPARLQLVATGDIPVTVEVTSDRRGEVARDELFLNCAAIPMGGQILGNADRLALQLAPCTANFRVELVVEGDEIKGQIVFQQPSFSISPVGGPRANQTLLVACQEALANIREVSANVKLAGTLQRPQVKLESTFGKELSSGITSAVVNLASQKSEALLAKVSGQVNEQLAKLESTKAGLEQELLAKLGENQKLFEALAGNTEILGVPQLGSLGGSILRK